MTWTGENRKILNFKKSLQLTRSCSDPEMDRNSEDIKICENQELDDDCSGLYSFMDFVANDSKSIC